jgi:hypothetical protein
MNFFTNSTLSDTSIAMYNRKLNEWISFMPKTQQHVSQIFSYPEFANKVLLENIKTQSNANIHSFYSSILAVLNHSTEYTSHIPQTQLDDIKKQWRELLKTNLKPYEERRLNSLPTELQLQKGGTFIKYEDIIKKRDSLPFGSIERLLLGFYTYIPPVRADYYATEIITFKETPSEPNYIRRVSPDIAYVILNEFKTKKTYKQIKNKLPPELMLELAESLRIKPRKYLFVNQTDKPFTPNAFVVWSGRILKRLFETEMPLTTIRHLFINTLDMNSKPKDILEISNKMGHDILTHMKYRWDLSKKEDEND